MRYYKIIVNVGLKVHKNVNNKKNCISISGDFLTTMH